MGIKINMGSGSAPKDGYINVDLAPAPFVDVVHDLETTPYPFKDGSASEIIALSVCEHIHNLDGFMAECHRILMTGGKLIIHVPYYHTSTAIRPDHVRFFNYNWHKYWTQNDSDAIQSQLKPSFLLESNEPQWAELGKTLFFLSKDTRIKLSKVFGEVIEGVDTVLLKDGD